MTWSLAVSIFAGVISGCVGIKFIEVVTDDTVGAMHIVLGLFIAILISSTGYLYDTKTWNVLLSNLIAVILYLPPMIFWYRQTGRSDN